MANGMNELLGIVHGLSRFLLGAAFGYWSAYRMYRDLSEHEFTRQTCIMTALCAGLAVVLLITEEILKGYLETPKP